MNSKDFHSRHQKDKLATMKDVGNLEGTSKPTVLLKCCLDGDSEEMKENLMNIKLKKDRVRSLRTTSASSHRLRAASESPARPRREAAREKVYFMSSDEEESEYEKRKAGNNGDEVRKSNRKSTARRYNEEVLSSGMSSLECDEPEPKSATKLKTAEIEKITNTDSPLKSPKRKKDDSNSFNVVSKRPARRSMRVASLEEGETSDDQLSVIPQKTPLPKRTPKSSKRKGFGGGSETSPATPSRAATDSYGVPGTGACTPRAMTTPKSVKQGSLRPRRSVASRRGMYKCASDDEDNDTVSGRNDSLVTRSRLSRGKRSSRLAASSEDDDDDDDFLPAACGEILPRPNRTPKSKRSKASAGNENVEQLSETVADESTPRKTRTPGRNARTPKKKSAKTPRNLKPTMPERTCSIPDTGSTMDVIRANLHVSAVPKSLPCREKEFKDIYGFVGRKISDSAGGCMYISGMPGTGKTATVHAVVRQLKDDVADGNLPAFQYIEVNGLRLTEPRQVFVRILQQLTGETCTPQQAQEILAKKFTTGRGLNKAVLLLVDEVDMLRNRRQDVVYNLFDWPSKAHSKLIVLTIANTMDLPERLLMGRVTSRLGLTRLTFQPYNHKQLQEIVTARLQDNKYFHSDAVQLVARKVAAVSGDARRALDICRRATELVNSDDEFVSTDVISNTLKQMMNSASIKTLQACSRMEQLFLQAVVAETKRTGVEETIFNSVYRQFKSICDFDGVKVPNVSQSLGIVNRLGSSRILLTEHGKADIMQTIYLNVNSDDIHYAMTKPVAA